MRLVTVDICNTETKSAFLSSSGVARVAELGGGKHGARVYIRGKRIRKVRGANASSAEDPPSEVDTFSKMALGGF